MAGGFHGGLICWSAAALGDSGTDLIHSASLTSRYLQEQERSLLARLLPGGQVCLATIDLEEVHTSQVSLKEIPSASLTRPPNSLPRLGGSQGFLRLLVCPKDGLALAQACTESGRYFS